MNHIIEHRNFVVSQIQKSFDDELEKARSGVYADNAENRKLNRVGMQYGSTQNTFKPGHKVKVTFDSGKVVDAVYREPYGKDKHLIAIGDKEYGVRTNQLEKVAGQYAGRKKTFYEKQAMADKLDELKEQYYDLKRERKQTEVDMEEELAGLGEEVINNGNHPVVVRYAKALERLDDKIAKVKDKYQKQRAKLSEFGW